MQIDALDQKGNPVSIATARRGVNYFCKECKGTLRLRGGRHTRLHFYHQSSTPSCHFAKKSLPHLNLQLTLQNLLPGEVILEKRFPSIQRIADVVWESHRIIFEIQCSPIREEEIHQRNRDYSSIGYTVVWIFHKRLRIGAIDPSAFPHYFMNIDDRGRGGIYDRLPLRNSPISPVDPRFPLFSPFTQQVLGHPLLKKRASLWPLRFKGDLFDVDPILLPTIESTKLLKINPFKQFYIRCLRLILKIFCY